MANSTTKDTFFGSSKRLVKFIIPFFILIFTTVIIYSDEKKDANICEIKVIKNGILLHTFALKSVDEIERAHNSVFYTNPIFYLFLVPGCVIFLGFFFRRKNIVQVLIVFGIFFLAGTSTDFPRELIKSGLSDVQSAKYQTALATFNLALEQEVQNPALFYNRALCFYMLNQKGLALHSLRESLKINPQDPVVKKTLTDIESELNLKFQVSPVQVLHPNISFSILILLFNLVLIALGLVFRYHQGTLFIVFVFFTFAFASNLIIFVDSLIKINESTGVVLVKEGTLKKIPLDKAQCWLHLKEGTSVKINGYAEDYALVKTGLGFEGWIKQAELVTD